MRNHFNEEEEMMLMDIVKFSLESNSPFYILIDECVKNCLYDVGLGDFESAAREINFIHNLPLSAVDVSNWDEYFFYAMEIPLYVEIAQKPHRLKSYIFDISLSQEKINENGILPKRRVDEQNKNS